MLNSNAGYFANWLRINFVNTRSEQTRLLIADYILNAISWKDTYMYIIANLAVILSIYQVKICCDNWTTVLWGMFRILLTVHHTWCINFDPK